MEFYEAINAEFYKDFEILIEIARNWLKVRNYILPTLYLINVLICVICFIVLSSPKLKKDVFFYLKIKAIADGLYLLILEKIIAVNRYFIIRSKTKILVRRKDNFLVLFAALFSLLYFPNIFLFLIVKEKTDRPDNFYIYHIEKIDVDESYYSWMIFRDFAANFLPILILIPAKIVILIQFKKFIVKKQKLVGSKKII
jgi:hypothetical protein